MRNSLQGNLFLAVRLLGTRVRSRGSGFICCGALLAAGNGPPTILILWQLAHLGAMFLACLVGAMAVAKRDRGPRPQCSGLIG